MANKGKMHLDRYIGTKLMPKDDGILSETI